MMALGQYKMPTRMTISRSAGTTTILWSMKPLMQMHTTTMMDIQAALSKTKLTSYTLIWKLLSNIARIIANTMPAMEYSVSSKLRNKSHIYPTPYPGLLSTMYRLPLPTNTGMYLQ